ncbi:MAG: 3-isopropylmalate dehydratase small subunit [Gaiellales bacterium]|nr:MAG: 3-isopropylmalate dehydratase small subunit [Gaiellales bacterium]
MVFEGTAHTYGRDVDTDVIIPARYLNTTDPDELAGYCMMDIDGDFAQRVQPGDIIVAGENFGCGSSREQAPVAIKAAGVACVVASSFARIFFRNAINIGLPILVCPGASEEIDTGDTVRVDMEQGVVTDLTSGKSFQAERFPEFMQEIVAAGGLMNHVREQLK